MIDFFINYLGHLLNLKFELIYYLGIVSDLFPRMVEEEIDYGVLDQAIRAACLKLNLQDVDGKHLFKIITEIIKNKL